ncbi:hypothetical protein [Scandinavium sp.]|uniref:hypothetical protein n=1 Tax=Scandinavium sp. TaxID=2830653 RepID=UPI0028977ACD|nr:hypothetical protein [Scandinavium sp.]
MKGTLSMNLNDLSSCSTMTKSPVWGVMDVLQWKLTPEKWGGGVGYIQKFKDSWVIHNRQIIKFAAAEFKLPAELLTGVCWIEVGGDPNFIDSVDLRSGPLTGAARNMLTGI